MTSVKQFKQENQQSNLYKQQETRNTYEPYQQTTTTEQQVVRSFTVHQCFESNLQLGFYCTSMF